MDGLRDFCCLSWGATIAATVKKNNPFPGGAPILTYSHLRFSKLVNSQGAWFTLDRFPSPEKECIATTILLQKRSSDSMQGVSFFGGPLLGVLFLKGAPQGNRCQCEEPQTLNKTPQQKCARPVSGHLTWPWVKNMYPKWLALVNGNLDYNLRSNSLWFNFDPHPPHGAPPWATAPPCPPRRGRRCDTAPSPPLLAAQGARRAGLVGNSVVQ